MDWGQMKGKDKHEIKGKFKDEFRSWMTNEKSRRLNQDRRRRKREYEELRRVYCNLSGRRDEIYNDKKSAFGHQSPAPHEATDNTANEDTTSAQEPKESQDRNIQQSEIPSKRTKSLR